MLLLHGKGLWLQRISDCEHGDPGAIVARARAAHLAHVILKIADGADAYNTDPATGRDVAAELILRLSEAGVDVWGWQTLYGERPAFKGQPEFNYHLREADAAIARALALSRVGLKGVVLDVRGDYERIPQRGRRAGEYMSRLRAALALPVALSAWKSPNAHPRFPWREFRTGCDLDLPQVFWIGRRREGARQLTMALSQFAALEPRLPFAAAGPAFFEGDWRPAPAEITEFLSTAMELLLPAVNLWQWDHLGLTGDEGPARNPHHWDFSAHWQALAQFEWSGPTLTAPAREVRTPAAIEPREAALAERPPNFASTLAGTPPEAAPAAPLMADISTLAPLAPEYAEPAEPDTVSIEAPPAHEGELPPPAPEPLLGAPQPEALPPVGPTSPGEIAPPAAPLESETALEPPVSEEALEPAITEPAEAEIPDWLREPPEPEIAVSAEPTLSVSDAAAGLAPAEASFGLPSPDDEVPAVALRGDELPEWLQGLEAEGAEAVSFSLTAEAPDDPPLAQMPDLPEFAPAFADRDEEGELPEWLQGAVLEGPAEGPVSFSLEVEGAVPSDDYAEEWEALLKDDAPDELPDWLRDEGHAVHLPAKPAPPSPPLPPTVTQFFKALRAGKLGEALALYGTGFAHANPQRVTQQTTDVYEFYHQLLREAQAGSLAIAGVSGSEAALDVRWSLRAASGALVQGADTFHLNRAGKIVYHYTSLQLRAAAQPA